MKRSPHVPITHINLDHICCNHRRLGETLAANGQRPGPTVAVPARDGSRMPSKNELDAARFQGAHVACIAAKVTA